MSGTADFSEAGELHALSLPGMPQIEWLRRWDADSGAEFFQRVKPEPDEESTVWELPRLTNSGEWVPVWDTEACSIAYIHSATKEARCAAPGARPGCTACEVPSAGSSGSPRQLGPDPEQTPERPPQITRAHPRDVLLEVWDDNEGVPYFVNAATGRSQWDEPAWEGAIVVEGVSGEDSRWLATIIEAASRAEAQDQEAGAPGGRYGRESLYSSGHDPSPGLAPEGELFPSRSSYSLSSARAASDHTFPEVRVGHRNLSNSARGGASGLPVWGGSR
ncbi:hypothetical protein FNF31_01778 [Cafeteria roenbergensis]|uniref:WW domain-containing protein n=1 Tax=Cafeteria roenbergensis TaxID=33653 RepID=A0A5A8DPH2_CAFRO|nr:hypothetical protein FNF31_01778 [Cafeteria roenbergensis]